MGSLLSASPFLAVRNKVVQPNSSLTNHLFPDLLPLISQTHPGMCLAGASQAVSLLSTSCRFDYPYCPLLSVTSSWAQGVRCSPLWFEGAESSLAHWDDAPWHLALFLEMPFLRFGVQAQLSVKRCSGFPEGCVPWESHVFAQLLVWSRIWGNIP